MRASFVILGLAVLLVGVMLTTIFFWSHFASSNGSAMGYQREMFVPVGIAVAEAGLMATGAKLKPSFH